MGNNCCAARDFGFKAKAFDLDWTKVPNIFGKGANAYDDVSRFDQAYENNDIPEFVSLCNSTCEIQSLPQRIHPWAADPETIGALAATQLAILASKAEHQEYKTEIREAGGIEALVDLLRSKRQDQLHAAVVALSFLSDDNSANCIRMYDAGAIPLLVNNMQSDVEGMRAACAQAARNVFVLDVIYRETFLQAGGVERLALFLNMTSGERSENQPLYAQLEAIYHLEDFVLDGDEEIPQFIQEVKAAGVYKKLKALEKCGDPAIEEAANALAARIAD